MRMRCASIAFLSAMLPTVAAGQSTVNQIPKFTNANGSLGDSAVTESGGKVGIGTTSPVAALDLVKSGSVIAVHTPTGNNALEIWNSGLSSKYWILSPETNGSNTNLGFYEIGGAAYGYRVTFQSGGNVGIGTTNPSERLDLDGGNVRIGHASFGAELAIGLKYNSFSDTASIHFGGSYNNYLGFYTADTGSGGERMRIDKSGNVGIGTTTPSAKLHVAGNVIVDGNLAAKYQDVAEWVDSAAPLEAGTVVAIDPSRANGVVAAVGAYDVSVAGVVSGQPGILLGEQGAGKVAVAQSGRVKVKADASYGAIKRGDLLVTSPTEGYAMRSEPLDIGGVAIHRPGTVLGKALESLASGQDEILVLLTLGNVPPAVEN